MRKYLFYFFIAIVFASCAKHNEIKPIHSRIYFDFFSISSADNFGDNKSFISLHGFVAASKEVYDNQLSSSIDFGYSGNILAVPEASRYFNNGYYRVSSWPSRNGGQFVTTTLSKSDFDSLKIIESVLPIATSTNNFKDNVSLQPGNVIAFSVTNGYGLIYVIDADLYQGQANIAVKYFLKN